MNEKTTAFDWLQMFAGCFALGIIMSLVQFNLFGTSLGHALLPLYAFMGAGTAIAYKAWGKLLPWNKKDE